ncbi:bifunctional methylenetetrahydrofolate dehydrogenase/methenyltetrahydrofolate cyclohydrolase [Microlunatus soli]|uniref:5,10-methylenetetrahydrofolate dehydrogenase (NAD+) n=1 Tax=Microlunatus soli TaxID=630515 RepID=A0A1H1WG06_9ACTN|nr:bifunctional methylenetetrahydrofolate dehydrogenase/methenyltetrahydrofolate cyclohydrolase [Microlunatus soli]SDS95590.1 5,10-methylenetetrahydrofolate dehydrogenase (NAD+) [Microlunatus soli]
MTASVLNPSVVAKEYRAEVRREVRRLAEGGRRLRIVGLLGQDEGPAATYAHYARRGSELVGIEMDVRRVDAGTVEREIAEANVDPEVDGIFLYYPIGGRATDRWLRELVDPRKDVEGLHSFWSRLLYENQRFLDSDSDRRAILPCTPLAILKLLQHAGMRNAGGDAPLRGMTACVINRSDLVGRPLSAMLANDGALVYSLDINGTVMFEPAIGRKAHDVRDSDVDRGTALGAADAVISAVPSADFERIQGAEIRAGAICVNVAENANFDDSIMDRASVFVPRVGPLTIAMATRNLTRLVDLSRA